MVDIQPSIRYDTPYVEPTPSFYSGASVSESVPYPFSVGIAGRAYQIQWDATAVGVCGARFKKTSLPLLRAQADNSNTPGEQSVSPEQFWRRSQESWHFGKGQTYLDRANSELRRYSDSMGIDPWTPWQLSLLNDTGLKLASANTGLQCMAAGSYVYITDGTALKYSANLTSWTTTTGTPNAALSITSDGYNIWTAHNASGIYATTSGAAAATSYATGTVGLVRFVKSRLMAAGGGKLYNVIASGALPTALLDLTARNFTWVDIVGAPTQIYAAGYSGDKSYIYRTAIKADGTALDVPIVAGQLPDGEIVRSLGEYLGYILIGTDLGVRFCSANSDGSLVIGSIISTYDPVYCFEGQDRFVWYGLSNYDENTGLGRLDLTTFTSTLTPAYAPDLMANDSGAVLGTVRSVATLNGARIFTVDGKGLFAESLNTPVASGSLVTGSIAYGISDPKVAMFVDIKHEPLNGSIDVAIIANSTASDLTVSGINAVGTSNVPNSVSPANAFPCRQLLGESFQVVVGLNSSGATSPVFTRWTLRSYPAPVRTGQWDIPILLFDTVTAGDTDYAVNVSNELDFLINLHKSQKIATLQIGNTVSQAVMYDYTWLPEAVGKDGNIRGTFYAQFREIAG